MKRRNILVVLAFCSLLIVSSCTRKDDGPYPPASQTFVLVHGAWQGAWAWQFVKQQLEAKGQKVIVVELPAHGDDLTPAAQVTLNSCAEKVVRAIESVNEKVILVGHSFGGMVVTTAAEKIPGRIKKLVYLGAFLPANGQSLLSLVAQDTESQLAPALVFAPDGVTADVSKESFIPIFCPDGSDAIKNLSANKYRTEPVLPATQPATITASSFGKVEKYYIHTVQDLVIGLKLQHRMVLATPNIVKTYSINSGHCPFLTQPDAVTALLMEIADY